jgi:hypothetical protein
LRAPAKRHQQGVIHVVDPVMFGDYRAGACECA